ncbi:MAG: MBL fold metallo-hydrolase, partial [Candidatus Promineifilaceae bacterium]
MNVKKFDTSLDRSIYSFPVLAFPELYSNIYVIKDGEKMVLVDCGSGMESSNQDLLAGLAALEETYGGSFKLVDMDAIFITHGHIDHFGGLPFVRRFTDAPAAVHSLDRRVLTHFEERVLVASRLLETFLQRAGVPDEKQTELIEMYLFAKGVYQSTPVEIIFKEGYLEDFGIEVIHVPGHCPGQVCLRIDDILLSADHVLSYTTPHQSPESITNHMGLDHYLQSLDKIAAVEGIRLGLGGHEEPILDLAARIEEIKGVHEGR